MSSLIVKKACPDVVYFDNNATTLVCPLAKKVHMSWISCYNASSDSKIAKPAKAMLEKAQDILLAHCQVSSATHTAIFTSGATESNCLIIKSCVRAFKKKRLEKGVDIKPHIVASATEHHSIMECLEDLVASGDIEVTYVRPTIYGNILPKDVEKAIKFNTCLITIMFANNEVPVINNLEEIGKIAHASKIPVHSDCVQIFGKYKIDMNKHNIDALSASAHKFYGPKGVGVLIINKALIEGYHLKAEIHGSQQYGLRGGTENIAGIASFMGALKYAFTNRKQKNEKLRKLQYTIIEKLKAIYDIGQYENYVNDGTGNNERKTLEIVLLGPPEDKKEFILPNTVLLAVAKNKGKPFCNVELKKALDAKNFVVSIGSACLTNSDKASHVLTAIGAPPVIKRGVIRISFGDSNTIEEINRFVKILKICIDKQCTDIKEHLEKQRKPQ
jgi:cysteine desulfurase